MYSWFHNLCLHFENWEALDGRGCVSRSARYQVDKHSEDPTSSQGAQLTSNLSTAQLRLKFSTTVCLSWNTKGFYSHCLNINFPRLPSHCYNFEFSLTWKRRIAAISLQAWPRLWSDLLNTIIRHFCLMSPNWTQSFIGVIFAFRVDLMIHLRARTEGCSHFERGGVLKSIGHDHRCQVYKFKPLWAFVHY